ncbi:MAG: hypothetical protein N2Z23_04035 [Pyrinomonadaceae bacterium]|nr:hypothetical protein [Pyrinomonadaceae bacterium]MCX7639598.1 hypothetical protein [Pyrinomonadaceae bacterium]MDW8303991.1 hypothetical protein [Acidobacteriota bacterium]
MNGEQKEWQVDKVAFTFPISSKFFIPDRFFNGDFFFLKWLKGIRIGW